MRYRGIGQAIFLMLATVSAAEGSLTGVLLPAAAGDQPKHLIILLHGYASNAQDLLPLAEWVPADTAVVTLQAPLTVSADHYAWYRSSSKMDQQIVSAAQQVNERIVQLQQQLQIPAANTILAGFSQGAVISWQITLTEPQRIGAVAIFSGRLPTVITGPYEHVDQRQLPKVFVGHGMADSVIPIQQGQRAAQYARQQGYSVSLHLYPKMQHEIAAGELQDFKQWLAGN